MFSQYFVISCVGGFIVACVGGFIFAGFGISRKTCICRWEHSRSFCDLGYIDVECQVQESVATLFPEGHNVSGSGHQGPQQRQLCGAWLVLQSRERVVSGVLGSTSRFSR